jgi:hypothetical protein
MIPVEIARRDFLKMSMVTAGAIMVTGCQKALDFDTEALSLRTSMAPNAKLAEIVRYATLAANGHNTQPWKFKLQENGIEIHPDSSRHLAAVDPIDREQWISLGCALENLVIAAGAAGFASEIIYPEGKSNFIKVNLQSSTPSLSSLFSAIPVRQSTRTEYRTESVLQDILNQVHAISTEPGVVLQFIEGKIEIERTLEYVNAGNLKQYADKAFLDELIHWLRFNQKEALASMDGLYSKCSGSPTVPRWLGEMFVSGTKPKSQADADAKKLRSSAGAVVIASERDDPESWVRCGQVFERLSLQLTTLELKSALLNQPIEIPELRGQFQSAMGMGNNQPQLLLRYGIADFMPYSLRRSMEDVLL